MGLGKTIQIITYLDGMFHAQRIRYALIVLPVSLFETWSVEFAKWCALAVHCGMCPSQFGVVGAVRDVALCERCGVGWGEAQSGRRGGLFLVCFAAFAPPPQGPTPTGGALARQVC